VGAVSVHGIVRDQQCQATKTEQLQELFAKNDVASFCLAAAGDGNVSVLCDSWTWFGQMSSNCVCCQCKLDKSFGIASGAARTL